MRPRVALCIDVDGERRLSLQEGAWSFSELRW